MVAIFVILTIVAFIVADSLVQRAKAQTESLALAPTGARRPAPALADIWMPQGVFVDAGHTWVAVDPSGRTHVGLDDFIQRAIGRIDEVELPEVGQEFRQGEKLFAIRQGERRAVFTAPLDGVISSVNESLTRHPEAIKANPYEQGWVCAVTPKNLARNLKRLFIAEEARAWLSQQLWRFQEFMAARPIEQMALGQVLQDGGQLTDGVLELMDEETWNLFANEFLGQPKAEGQTEA